MPTSVASNVVALASQWRDAVARTVGSTRRISVLYSGGLDSSLVALAARSHADVELVTVGVPRCPDLIAGAQGAELLGLPWKGRTIGPDDVKSILESDGPLLAGRSLLTRAVLIGLALGLDASQTPHVLCGQGADELFLGYAHFVGLSPDRLGERRGGDLDRLLTNDWPPSLALSERRGKRLGSPFLDSDFLRYVRALSIEDLQAGEGRKPLLREVARIEGVPEELAMRPKRAFQYGSGIERLLKSLGSEV